MPTQVKSIGKAGETLGLTTGVAVAAGFVGQVLSASLSNVALTVSGTGYTFGQLTLTAGIWVVYSNFIITAPGGSAKTDTAMCINTSASFTSTYSTSDTSTNVSLTGRMNISRVINTDGVTGNIAYVIGYMSYTGGSPTTVAANSNLYAVRIA